MYKFLSQFNLFIFYVINPVEAVSLHSVYIDDLHTTHTHTHAHLLRIKSRAHTHTECAKNTATNIQHPTDSYHMTCVVKYHCKASETKHCNRCIRLDNLIFPCERRKNTGNAHTVCMNFIENTFPIKKYLLAQTHTSSHMTCQIESHEKDVLVYNTSQGN